MNLKSMSMASIKLKFKASMMQDKEGFLYYQVIHQRVVRCIRTKYGLFSWEWDNKYDWIIKPELKEPRYDQLKLIIEKVEMDIQRLQGVISYFENNNRTYSAYEVVANFHELLRNEMSFFDYARNYIDKLRQLGNPGTADNHNSTLNSFMNYRRGLDLQFSMITAGIMEGYESYLKLRGSCRNTTSFYMRNLRSIYNLAVENGITEHKEIFKHVYTGVDKTIKRAISINDIRRIKELDLTLNHTLEIARDLFMFSFYTRGMSFVDIVYLKKKDIKCGSLIYRRHKTGQQLCIGWEKEMQAIVDKYPNPTPFLLPVIIKEDGTEYRQYKNALMLINRKLKKIAKLAGISQSLSMYTSRHSWATIARDKNIPLSVISKGLGHINDVNTQIYLASIKTEEVDKANRKIMKELIGR